MMNGIGQKLKKTTRKIGQRGKQKIVFKGIKFLEHELAPYIYGFKNFKSTKLQMYSWGEQYFQGIKSVSHVTFAVIQNKYV